MLLPRERPDVPRYSFWECYRPALEVGGDSYDYIQTCREGQDGDFRWVISVGDVSGKGMPAALLSAAVRPKFVMRSEAGARRPRCSWMSTGTSATGASTRVL